MGSDAVSPVVPNGSRLQLQLLSNEEKAAEGAASKEWPEREDGAPFCGLEKPWERETVPQQFPATPHPWCGEIP